jgi:tetraacyldisaccharide 4'-kinase
MNRLKKRVEDIMHGADTHPPVSAASILQLFAGIYGLGQRLRAQMYRRHIIKPRRLPCKVIAIGNITVGGTGKTPMTIFVARYLQRLGYRPAVVSRGYKGRAEKIGAVVSDGKKILLGPDQAGDEPFLMACRLSHIPVAVGGNRFAVGTMVLKEFDVDVIVLDDAYQHLKLARDLDLVLLDRKRPFGNGHLLPRGVLREPVSGLKRAHGFILTRSDVPAHGDAAISLETLERVLPRAPIFVSRHVPYYYQIDKGQSYRFEDISNQSNSDAFGALQDRTVFAFSGIGRNDDFKRTVEGFNCKIAGFRFFADHHHYSEDDLAQICRRAQDAGADLIMTTEKDHARLADIPSWPLDLGVVGVRISFGDDADDFENFIRQQLADAANTGIA